MAYVIRIIQATILFFRTVFASIIFCFKMRKTSAISKAKDVVENDKKVILCNKGFGSNMKS